MKKLTCQTNICSSFFQKHKCSFNIFDSYIWAVAILSQLCLPPFYILRVTVFNDLIDEKRLNPNF